MAELAARGDAELSEDLAQVVLDRAGADEQPGADLRVGQPLAGQPGDLGLLAGQLLIASGGGALAGGLASGPQLAPGPVGERVHPHGLEHVVGGAQLLARLHAAAPPTQPFPEKQMGAREFCADAGLAEARDRL